MPTSEWKWFGNAGHLIVSHWCRFHLCTLVGPWLVSTVGEYVPDEGVRELLARSRGITLKGRGDERLADYMRQVGFDELGLNRKYETMVFLAGEPCTAPECGCGLPTLADASERDMRGYNTAGEATKGHLEMCEKWDKVKTEEETCLLNS